MRKNLIFFIIFVCFVFLLPIIFLNKNILITTGLENVISYKEISLKIEDYNYDKYKTIKLLHKKKDVVEELNLDEYIANVVSAEMPVKYELEALKAQAIVARTYTIYKITTSKKHKNADICDDSTCCQAWISKEDRLKKWKENKRNENWNKIIKAVNETKGKVITYNGKPINAFFHSNSGGKTEIPFYVWGGTGYPYLQSVETSGEDNYSEYKSEKEFTKKEFKKIIKEKYNNLKINFNDKDAIFIKERDSSNRVISVKIGNLSLSGVETRSILGLRSTNFEIEIKDNTIKFSVIRIWTWSWYEPNWSK